MDDSFNMMDPNDPYELFSTPPSEIVLSSTPSKRPGRRQGRKKAVAPNSARKAVLSKKQAVNPRTSISFDSGRPLKKADTSHSSSLITTSPKTTTRTTRVLRNRNVNKDIRSAADTSQTNNNRTLTRKPRAKKATSTNLWDKCLKSNPELAQFVDNFNQSLEEALSKPLDISGDE